jgi:hypothetical protein
MRLSVKPQKVELVILETKVSEFETEMKILMSQLTTVTREYHSYKNALALAKLRRINEKS